MTNHANDMQRAHCKTSSALWWNFSHFMSMILSRQLHAATKKLVMTCSNRQTHSLMKSLSSVKMTRQLHQTAQLASLNADSVIVQVMPMKYLPD